MQHSIDVKKLGPQGEIMANAVSACVHCGFCLPACPTYQVLGEEMDSPRGRIFLMKEVLEGSLTPEQVEPYIDKCLGCVGCVTACPSGVPYGDLISTYRGWAEPQRQRPALQKIMRMAIHRTLPYPDRFRAAAYLGKLGKLVKPILPAELKAPLGLLPDHLPASQSFMEVIPAIGEKRATVAMLAGCAQQVLKPNFNAATIWVLTRNGVEVHIPKTQGCCGAAAMHGGERKIALELARINLKAFANASYDAIVSNAAGCGAGLKEYHLLFHGEPEEKEAAGFSKRVKDISVFLVDIGFAPLQNQKKIRVAYHDACHLSHAQKVKSQPRALLNAIPGVELVEIPEGDLCCGSAGTYNLEQPEMANTLGERKARNIISVKPDLIVTGNIGCYTQIETHMKRFGVKVPIMHTIEFLDQIYSKQPAVDS